MGKDISSAGVTERNGLGQQAAYLTPRFLFLKHYLAVICKMDHGVGVGGSRWFPEGQNPVGNLIRCPVNIDSPRYLHSVFTVRSLFSQNVGLTDLEIWEVTGLSYSW